MLPTRRIDGQDPLIAGPRMARPATPVDTTLSVAEPQSRNAERAHVVYLRIGSTLRALAG